MTMPNFLIIGAMRSGTSSLYHYLRQHPQIYMSPVKEPQFFVLEGYELNYSQGERGEVDQKLWKGSVANIEDYRALFQRVSDEKAIGEASPLYLTRSSIASERIRHYIPDAKLIAILRNPVERAYSHFVYYVMHGLEPLTDFAQVFQENRFFYKETGFYYAKLTSYFEIFDRNQIKVYLYEDLQTDPIGLLQDIFRFIGVDETFVPDVSIKHQASVIPKNKVVAPLTFETRRQLTKVYREDMERLQDLIQRDLSEWLDVSLEAHAANLEQLVASKEAHISNLVASKEARISSLEQRLTAIESTRAWRLALKFYAFCHFVSRAVELIKRVVRKIKGAEVDQGLNMSRLGEGQMALEEYKLLCQNAAQRWGVSSEVHPEDFIFRFVIEHPIFQSKEKAVEYYFNDGANSARKLHKILVDICGFGDDRLNLLEFASGYGCVTRHVRNVTPFCRITACDIHQQAVQFIQEKLGVEAVSSASHPEDLDLNRLFDVVFALSFFSHMPKKTFARWLKKLSSFVRPEGYFIFTTHGLLSRKISNNCQFDKDGFYFYPASEQKDLSTKEYGSTVVTPQYVFNRIFEIPNLALKHFYEGYWWNHQDLYIVKVVGGF